LQSDYNKAIAQLDKEPVTTEIDRRTITLSFISIGRFLWGELA